MSLSTSWLCLSGLDKERALVALDLRDTGEPVLPSACEFAGATLGDGRVVLVLEGFLHPMLRRGALESLSAEATVTAWTGSERTNASMASQFRDGKRVWEVSHVHDEGPTHLARAGRPPKALDGLLAAALEAHQRSGHDAVFGVPLALASKVAGVTPELRFTRLELVLHEPFARQTCTWRTLLEAEEAERLKQAHPDLTAALAPRLAAALAPLGFTAATEPGLKHAFTRTTGELTVRARVAAVGHGHLNVLLEAEHALANRAVAQFKPSLESWGDLPYGLLLSTLEGRSGAYLVQNPRALEAFGALIDTRVPQHLQALSELPAWDRAMTKTFASRPLVEFPYKRRYQLLAGAWLAGNPELPSMLEACSTSEAQAEQCAQLLALLRDQYPR